MGSHACGKPVEGGLAGGVEIKKHPGWSRDASVLNNYSVTI